MLSGTNSHLYPKDVKQKTALIDSCALTKAIDNIALAEDLLPPQQRRKVFNLLQGALKTGRAEVRRRFEEQHSGTTVVHAQCYLMDQILKLIFHYVNNQFYPLETRGKASQISIAAAGGYGRGELAPQSDIDLLILTPRKNRERNKGAIEAVLYFLWDLNLKVGHSVCSVDEAITEAKGDITIATNLLEGRFLCGDTRLYEALARRYERSIQKKIGKEFIEKKLQEREARHNKQGQSRYHLEPDIKDGKGGLRDLQTLFWIAKFIYGVNDVGELVEKGVFTTKEAGEFAKAQAFLWSLRCALHYMTNRPEERLSLDIQPYLAQDMGYKNHAGTRAVERLMKHYFLVAKNVGSLTRIFCAALEAEQKKKFGIDPPAPGRKRRCKVIEGFPVEGNWLCLPPTESLRQNKLNILKIFYLSQQQDLDIHPNALREISLSLSLIDRDFRHSPEATALFLEILTSPKDPAKTLRRMNESSVLGRFLPCFGQVVALMQFNMYHSYTVDEHTLFTIDVLGQIERGEIKQEAPIASEVIHKIQSRRALYVAMLLHDIAKGKPGDHSTEGAKVAEKLCPKLGLTPKETETVVWLVRQHLTMSETAFSRDIHDDRTIQTFAEVVQSSERLRLLLVLTVADIRGVGPNVWNAWKAALLRDLYWRTESLFSQGQDSAGKKERLAIQKQRLSDKLLSKGWPQALIQKHLERGEDDYWLSTQAEEQARHAEMIQQSEDAKVPLALRSYPDHYRQSTEIALYAKNHLGLFSQTAGALSAAGCSIKGATIYPFANGMVLDSFHVWDAQNRHLLEEEQRLQEVTGTIEKVLTGAASLDCLLRNVKTLTPKRVVTAMPVSPQVFVDNNASQNYTVIEINGLDRPSLLYNLTQTLNNLDILIHSARISTYGLQALDVFYVQTALKEKVTCRQKISLIRTEILEIF